MTLAALRRSRPFRFASWLALWAMLLPALLPLLHAPAAMAGSGMPPICHMAMKDMAPAPMPHAADRGQVPVREKSGPVCPICQSLSNLAQGFVAPEQAGPVYVRVAGADAVFFSRTLVVFEPSSLTWPRAPPVLA